jgi:hypothetical protein
MQQRGPPTAADDELVQFLTLENQGCLVSDLERLPNPCLI